MTSTAIIMRYNVKDNEIQELPLCHTSLHSVAGLLQTNGASSLVKFGIPSKPYFLTVEEKVEPN